MDDENYKDNDKLSNCCGAPIYSDMDICSACKEHCGEVIICPQCGEDFEPKDGEELCPDCFDDEIIAMKFGGV